ncbi:hypothetical protein WJX79_002928 [Trebouxia sp. C0005]
MFSSRLIQVIGDSVKQHSPGHFQRLQGQSLIVGSLAVNALQLAKSLRTLLTDHQTTGGEVAIKASAADAVPPVVAIWLNRSSGYAVAVLAVLASGCAFMPLDTSSPCSHMAQILQQARPSILIWADRDTEGGSTGKPTGVCGTEAGILNRINWMQKKHPVRTGDKMAFKTSTSFVDHLWELFAPFLLGVDSVILPDETVKNPALLMQALIKHRVTHLTAVPTLLHALVPYLQACPLSLSHQVTATATSPDMLAVSPGQHLMGLDRDLGTDSMHTRKDINSPQKGANSQQTGGLSQGFTGVHDVSASVPVARQQQQGLEQVSNPASSSAPTAAVATPYLLPADDQAGLHAARAQGSDNDAKQKSNPMVSAGWPLTGFAVFILPVTEASETQHADEEHVTKAAVKLLPAGQTGEVVVTGVGLAAGYHRNSELTRQRFLNMNFSQLESQKADISGWDNLKAHPASHITCFRTGDLGYLTPNGALHICGRKDLQVKLRGMRVVLTDVEAALMSHPAVAAAAACTWPLPANRGLALAVYVHLVAPSALSQPAAHTACQAVDDITEELLRWCRAVWKRALPARAEAGLTITSDCQAVVVGCRNGSLHFLGIATGHQLAVVDTGGTIKSPPIVDSWQGWGCLWVSSHGRQLFACTSEGVVLAQCKVSGPVSAAVALDHPHCLVYVATLSAQLQAFHVSDDHFSLWPAWTYQVSAPIFSTPVVDTMTSTLLVTAVDGVITALSHQDSGSCADAR